MKNSMADLLYGLGLAATPLVVTFAALTMTIIVCMIIYLLWRYVVLGAIKRYNNRSNKAWISIMLESNVFTFLIFVVQGIIVNIQVRLWVPPGAANSILEVCTYLWILVFAMLALLAFINIVDHMTQRLDLARKIPFHGVAQALKMVLFVIFIILVISVLIGRSPTILLSGLGAMTAVLMLVFKDPIMGFVSGLQLSSYDLVAVGDWVEMPKYNVDGSVLEIGLTTVKVQNWDNTIVSIPTYALMSDSFKNWRGMQESGGRRIKRSINIDTTSIRFLTQDDFYRLKQAKLLTAYLDNKAEEIEKYNKNLSVTVSDFVNGRHLTNVGTFRAYLVSYLTASPNIHKDMTLMVRQLAPTTEGLPLELYCFTNTTVWTAYEAIQSDIFDHIFAVLPEFDLRAYQAPTGSDFRSLASAAVEKVT